MDTKTETLIVGAGPAGLQLGYFLQQAARDYLIVERDGPGSFFKRFPRHRTLISINKVHTGKTDPEINLRWDWNSLLCEDEALRFPRYSEQYFPQADDLVRYLEDFTRRHELHLRRRVEATRIARDDDGFIVTDARGNIYRSLRVVLATGVSRPYVPDIPGIEHAEQYADVTVDAADFKNQRVLILGKGNSGFETADNLVGTASVIHIAGPHSVRMAWESRFVGHLRAVNNNFIDTYLLKSQNAILDVVCERIERRDGRFYVTFLYMHADNERETIVYDRVICCTGFGVATELFDATSRPRLAVNDRFPEMTSAFESTNVPGLYFAGTIMQMRDYKKKQSGFIHGFRYNVRALARILEERYRQAAWPHRTIAATAKSATDAILQRANTSSALWQQTDFLCDVLVLPRDGTPARYYEEVPLAYVDDGGFIEHNDYYVITLDFGREVLAVAANPLAVTRPHKDDPSRADHSSGIHPIVRHYVSAALVSTHHVMEDLEAEFCEDVHVGPLTWYLERELAERDAQALARKMA